MATSDYLPKIVESIGENLEFFFSPPTPVVYAVY